MTFANSGNDDSVATVMNDALPLGVSYSPTSIQISAGANAGTKTDGPGDDQCEYTSGTRAVTCRLGSGANASSGGQLAVGASTTVKFRVTVDAGASGTISNQGFVNAAGLSGAPPQNFPTDGDAGTPGAQTTDIVVTAPPATATPTVTPTDTPTDTPTATPTATPTSTPPAATATATATSTPVPSGPGPVVISQIYAAGGEVGSVWHNDFIELFNRSTAPVNLANWSVQYANTNSSTWQALLLAGVLQPGQYYLLQLDTGSSGGAPLPTPDLTATTVLNVAIGRVALMPSRARISGNCPPAGSWVDFVGYGTGVTCSEGGSPVPNLTLTGSAQRLNNGCTDTNVNGSDFTVVNSSSPGPRNSAYPLNSCTGAPSPTPTAPPTPSQGAAVVISQVYGSSGGVGSPWKSDFVELFNRGSTPVNLYGWSLQYANTDSATWQKTLFPIGTVIQPGRYLLVNHGGSGTGAALPPADVTNTVLMNGTLGKVALVNGTAGLLGKCPAAGTYVDFVGYGAAVSCSEGSQPTGNLSNPNSAVRSGGGCVDTNRNGPDFTVQGAGAPGPRNSASAANPCTTGVAARGGQSASGKTVAASGGAAPGSVPLQGVELSPSVDSLGGWSMAAAGLLVLGLAFGSRRLARNPVARA